MHVTRFGGFWVFARSVVAALLFAPGLALAAGDSWAATSTTGAAEARQYHTAIWTGSTMIVWGGLTTTTFASINTGGSFNPVSNLWTAVTTTNAPTPRQSHTAVWTGSKMIVWGGTDGTSSFDEGFLYDPVANSWTPISQTHAPSARTSHTAVWTGSKMIVWGGTDGVSNFSDGAAYDPAANSWAPISGKNAPSARYDHTAVWTGSKMIIWGGLSTSLDLNSGGIYDPASDAWTATATLNAPSARYFHTAVWTGSKMIVWGGASDASNTDLNTGGALDPETNVWSSTTLKNPPAARRLHSAVWTGTEMAVWGGFAFGGSGVYFASGALYDPLMNSWSPMTTTGAPSARYSHTAVWTGTEMIVWGGNNGAVDVSSGGIYSPAAGPCPTDGARNCVSPISAGTDVRSHGRTNQK